MQMFHVNEDAARQWVTGIIVAEETSDIDGETHAAPAPCITEPAKATARPPIGLAWRPRSPGQEDATAQLIRYAQQPPNTLSGPQHTHVAIEFVDDGDDWAYHFLLHVDAPTPLTLTSRARPVQQLGTDGASGIEAALAILREAARAANALLDQLSAFCAASSPLAQHSALPPREVPPERGQG